MVYIIGKVTYINKNYIYLESNYVGLKIFVKQDEKAVLNKVMKFYTTEITVETSKGQSFKQLYGFLNFTDFILFNKLITLPSIGPKTAINILSNNSELLISCIINKDLIALEKLPGITERCAKIIISNLAEDYCNKSANKQSLNLEAEIKEPDESNQVKVTNDFNETSINNQNQSDEEKYIEIISSLRALGYSKSEIEYGINKLDETKYKEFVPEDVLADIIKNITNHKMS
ncbi:hypothetical protein II941_01945 [bacterium]|nr:hypothetical protein [bacterium]